LYTIDIIYNILVSAAGKDTQKQGKNLGLCQKETLNKNFSGPTARLFFLQPMARLNFLTNGTAVSFCNKPMAGFHLKLRAVVANRMAQMASEKEKTKNNCLLQPDQDTFVLGVLLMEIFHCFFLTLLDYNRQGWHGPEKN
jgi:hypothetical protein